MDLIKPALAEPCSSDEQALTLLERDGWHLEQKVNGERLLVHCDGPGVVGVNRKGTPTTMPRHITESFVGFDGEWAFDGEIVGRDYWVFDMPKAMGSIGLSTPYSERRRVLDALWPQLEMGEGVHLLPSMTTTEDKFVLAKALVDNQAEGGMLKSGASPYVPGRRTTHCMKWKFVKEVDCVVLATGIDGKSNMSIGVYDGKRLVEVATCTALAGDGPRVQVGDVVAVKCLYASKDLRLVQPTYPKIRHDKDRRECTMDQVTAIVTSEKVIA